MKCELLARIAGLYLSPLDVRWIPHDKPIVESASSTRSHSPTSTYVFSWRKNIDIWEFSP